MKSEISTINILAYTETYIKGPDGDLLLNSDDPQDNIIVHTLPKEGDMINIWTTKGVTFITILKQIKSVFL
jgi:hypothetical protein